MNLRNLILLFTLAINLIVFGAKENLIQGIRGNGLISPLNALVVTDDWFSEYPIPMTPTIFTLVSSEAKVKLWFDDALKDYYSSAWVLTLTYDISLTRADGITVDTYTSEELSINYDPSIPYQDIALTRYKTQDYIKVVVSNIQITSNTLPTTDIPDDIYLDVELDAERYYVLASNEVPTVSYVTTALSTNFSDELELRWDYIEGAESYDVEWLFIDIPESALSSYSGDYDFKNATRVNCLATHYSINLAYPRGIFLFRVRPVGKTVINGQVKRVEGTWSIIAGSGSATSISTQEKYEWNGLLPGMNWQYQASFAEEGKRGERMGFYDGSLKPRQSVAVNTSDNTVLINQPIYDYLGRATLQTLPVPQENEGLGFYPDRTKIGEGDYYDFTNFDLDHSNAALHNVMDPDPMTGLPIANHYNDNGSAIGVHSDYVASTDDYPFARTVLRNDGTGRVKSQTAVGQTQIGAGALNDLDAKHSKYYYGTPTQEELYRLFGNEVGNASHYKKNTVIDQNGQAHIQYLDMSGRVIATALAGAKPDNLLLIDSYPDDFDDITSDLTVNNYATLDNELLINKTITVSVPTLYTFDYSLSEEILTDLCMTSNFYYTYDLLIYIEDENYERISIDYDSDVNTADTDEYLVTDVTLQTDLDWTVTLQPGNYTITRVLSLNQDYLATLYSAYTGTPNASCFGTYTVTEGSPCNEAETDLCLSEHGFVDEDGNTWYLNEYGDVLGMIPDGGTINDVVLEPGVALGSLQTILALIKDCRLADNIIMLDECELKFNKMKRDVSPGGQYFDNVPFLSNEPTDNDWLLNNTPSNYYSTVHSGATSWDNVRDNWDDSYADDLVEHHPEYCTYLYHCGQITGTYDDGVNTPYSVTITDCPTNFTGLTATAYDHLMNSVTTNITMPGTQGYLFNPLNTGQSTATTTAQNKEDYQPVAANLADDKIDPFVACRNHLTAEIELTLTQYFDAMQDGTEYHSIWYVLEDLDEIHTGSPISNTIYPQATIDFYQYLHGDGTVDGLLGGGADQVTPYQFFRGFYLYNRNYAAYHAIDNFTSFSSPNSSCDPDFVNSPNGDGLDGFGFMILYPENTLYENYNPSNMETYVDNQIDDQCESQCEAAAIVWLAEMGDCASDANKAIMKQYFIEICTESCDETNTSGTDDMSPAASSNFGWGTFSSFEDVVDHYNTSVTDATNPDDCTAPTHPPADPVDQLETQACQCNQITEFVSGFYTAEGVTIPTTFDLEDDLTEAQETDLLEALEDQLEDTETATISDLQDWIDNCTNSVTLTGIPVTFECNDLPTYDLGDFDDDCGDAIDALISYNDLQAYNASVLDAWLVFIHGYEENAWDDIENKEIFTMAYTLEEYHYTLFYYDQAGNLVKTVPPSGIHLKTTSNGDTEGLDAAEIQDCYDHVASPTVEPYIHPNHSQITNYKYNSLQQLIEQNTPDGGKTIFFYDQLGRLLVSQNARQADLYNNTPSERVYSYTRYDELGRVVEAGEVTAGSDMTSATAEDPLAYHNWLSGATARDEVIRTTYGDYADANAATALNNVDPNSTRNRIGSVTYKKSGMTNITSSATYDNAIHYSYDFLGNVKTVLDDSKDIREVIANDQQYKRTDYHYDLVSGNVNQVDYQAGEADQFYHAYEYDANNRLTNAYTSSNGEIWEKECKSFYYAHGPLARIEIGDQVVQAQDYVYTNNGWLKTVNSSINNHEWDAGKDGKTGTDHEFFGRDVMAFSLHYYTDDYQAANTTAAADLIADQTHSAYVVANRDLFNGNISRITTSISDNSEVGLAVFSNWYTYDQLQRIKVSKTYKSAAGDIRANNAIASGTTNGDYEVNYSFDGNGNLETLKRNMAGGTMDQFTYNYHTTKINQLEYVDDAASSIISNEDIDDQSAGNYVYDEIGQLTKDVSAEIDEIVWMVTGKVKKIIFDVSSSLDYVEFDYNPMGMRISKKVMQDNGDYVQTFYVYDASGNAIATYDYKDISSSTSFHLNDHTIYGAKRLGTITRDIDMLNQPAQTDKLHRQLGHKQYELSEHRGNVMQVISDRKLTIDTDNNLKVDYYTADVTSYSDYYPYGMQMPGRHATAGDSYRYGFQGQEKDDEIKGEGNSVNYKYRMHDPRIGRFFAVDPLAPKYPHNSVYAFSENRVIDGVELEGLEFNHYLHSWVIRPGDTYIKIANELQVDYGIDVTWQQLLEYTGTDPHKLQPGQTVQIFKTLGDAQRQGFALEFVPNSDEGYYDILFKSLHEEFDFLANFSSADDYYVLKRGVHADGTEATTFDKNMAAVFVLLPFSAKSVKSLRNIYVVAKAFNKVTYGTNMLTKFRKHSAEILAAARGNGIALPKGVKLEETQKAFKGYMQYVVNNGTSFVSPYMKEGDAIWTKLGDSIVVRKKNGEFITHWNTGTKRGEEALKHWNEKVTKSTVPVPLINGN